MVNQNQEGRFGMQLPQRKGSNINLNANDLARLMTQGQPGNVTGGGNQPGILGLLNQQRQNDSFQMTPKFNPMMTTADLINRNTDSPNMVQSRGPMTNPAVDPVTQIMQELQKLMTQQGSMNFQPTQMPTFDPNRFKNQAESAVNAQYDPIIQGIQAQQGQTQQRARQNRVSL